MKFAVFSDIHGNMPALQTVSDHIDRWGADFVVVNGDIINRGPLPRESWEFVVERRDRDGWAVTKGNHEEYVLNHVHGTAETFFPMSHWTMQKMTGTFEALDALPPIWSYSGAEMGEMRVTHASMAGSRRGIYPMATNAELDELVAPPPAVLCVGHTHLPVIKLYQQCMIVNAGSAGQPAWGETRACYAQVTWQNGSWSADIIRLDYDREQTDRDFKHSGILAETDLVTQIIYHEWRTGHALLMAWSHSYWPAVKAGEVEEEAMLRRFLADYDLPIVR